MQRSRDRYAERARRLAQRYTHMLERATTESQRAAIDAAYAADLEAPALRFRRRSVNVEHHQPPRHTLDVVGARSIMAAFYGVRDHLWRRDRWRPDHPGGPIGKRHTQQISQNCRAVLNHLLDKAVRHGQVWPTHATIAVACRTSTRTVRRCLAWLRANNFISWQRRVKWIVGALGLREARQTSNAYEIVEHGRYGDAALNTLPKPSRVLTLAERAQQLAGGLAAALRVPMVAATSGHAGRLAFNPAGLTTQFDDAEPDRGVGAA